MVEVTYHCPYCGALTSIERDGYLRDKSVTPDPLEDWEYAATTGDFEDADGIEFVCLGDADPLAADADGDVIEPDGATPTGGDPVDVSDAGDTDETDGDHDGDGCGRTFYLNFVRFEDGQEVDPAVPLEAYDDRPRFDFRADR